MNQDNIVSKPRPRGQMDVLYYSNYCKHSQHILTYIVKANLIEKVNCVCIDKRHRDVNNNQLYVALENGEKVLLPPGIHSVPSLLQVTKNHTIVSGVQTIMEWFQTGTQYNQNTSKVSNTRMLDDSEPASFDLFGSAANSNIFSEKFTNYGLSPDALSAKGVGNDRSLYNYVSVHDNIIIPTPEDKYKPDKLSSDITVDKLQQQRNMDSY
jgi:hypothetical protein